MTTQGEMSYLTNKWEHGLRERASFDHEGKLFSMRATESLRKHLLFTKIAEEI